MECRPSYELKDRDGNRVTGGDARARLEEESLSLMPESGEALHISYRDLDELVSGDYRLNLRLVSGEEISLSHLGRDYEDFTRELSRMRNELILKDMLMEEKLVKPGIKARYSLEQGGAGERSGNGEVRLYETALVLLPEWGEPFRIPFGNIAEVRDADYAVDVIDDSGDGLHLSMMGKEYDPFVRAVKDRIGELDLKVQALLKDLAPQTDIPSLMRASRLMREGRAAAKSDLEREAPALWGELEKRLELVGIKGEYDFLRPMAREEKMHIGLKRGLMGELTGEYVWFLAPIYSTDAQEPGNALAMEAASSQGGGRATYFFRILSRGDYREAGDMATLDRRAGELIAATNRCLQTINFRREPIYLPDDRLHEPRYARYRFSVARLPELRLLRDLFIGRVIHSSPEQWKRDVEDLLRFNVTAVGDGEKWRRGEAFMEEGGEDAPLD
jgi:hypothetical protein